MHFKWLPPTPPPLPSWGHFSKSNRDPLYDRSLERPVTTYWWYGVPLPIGRTFLNFADTSHAIYHWKSLWPIIGVRHIPWTSCIISAGVFLNFPDIYVSVSFFLKAYYNNEFIYSRKYPIRGLKIAITIRIKNKHNTN